MCDLSPSDYSVSTINLLAVSNAQDEHNEAFVFNFADKPEIAHAVFPEFSKAGALQGSPDATRIV